MKALLVVDAQRDFMPGGALAVPKGDEIISWINKHRDFYKQVIWTKDWHPIGHCSFVKSGGKWPMHCVQETSGSELAYGLEIRKGEYVVTKGTNLNYDSYSAFFDDGGAKTGLTQLLKKLNIDELDIVGLATDYCVRFTVLDALKEGFKVNVILAGCRGIDPDSIADATMAMKDAGATVR
jgi:nicotinamidase/pyrazinamidase